MNIEQIVGLFTTANIIPFVLGILTSEATRRLVALAIRSWAAKQLAAAAKTPSTEDDDEARARADAAHILAGVIEPKKDGK